MRLLELWLRRHGEARAGVLERFVRFENSTALRFAPSQLEAVAPEPAALAIDAAALTAALEAGTLKAIRVTPSFMGLLGAAGELPFHTTEQVAAHAGQHRDHGPRALLDTFSSRSLTLFYQAWRKYRLELRYQLDGHDSFLPLLLSLAGLGNEALRRRLGDADGGGVLDESLGHFAAALRQRPMSATQMARVLADYFDVPLRAEQFVGGWYPVPPGQETLLGRSNSVLGGGALAGERVWQRHLRLRLLIGPLERAAFARFLPGRAGARALASMLTMFTGVALEVEVQLLLCAADVEGATLGGARQLGWDSFLATGPAGADRGDVRYMLNPV